MSDTNQILSHLRSLKPVRRLPGRNITKADILMYRQPGVDLAVKDYSARPWLVRNTVGRFLIRREATAYRAASGIPGLPEFFGRLGSFAIVRRWIEARPLAESPRVPVDNSVFDRIERIVASLHDRGIALADLHHRDVLLADDGSIYLVDLATAWVLGDHPSGLRRVLFERFRDADRVALARMRARWRGDDVEAAVSQAGARAAAWHRRGRRLKRLWSELLRLARRP